MNNFESEIGVVNEFISNINIKRSNIKNKKSFFINAVCVISSSNNSSDDEKYEEGTHYNFHINVKKNYAELDQNNEIIKDDSDKVKYTLS